ncbi:82_t:CDS:1, partial [Funneliformis caledonium]
KDFTVQALEPGYVQFYSDPKNPKRRYVGIVFNPDDKLPRAPTDPRSRRFGLIDLAAYRGELKKSRKLAMSLRQNNS